MIHRITFAPGICRVGMCNLYLGDELGGIESFSDPQENDFFAPQPLGHLAEAGQSLGFQPGLVVVYSKYHRTSVERQGEYRTGGRGSSGNFEYSRGFRMSLRGSRSARVPPKPPRCRSHNKLYTIKFCVHRSSEVFIRSMQVGLAVSELPS